MDRLLAALSSRQITEWMAYASLEPFGPPADDTRAGVVAAAVANNRFGRPAGSRVFLPADFFASLRESGRRQHWRHMAETLKGMTRAMGGTVHARPADPAG